MTESNTDTLRLIDRDGDQLGVMSRRAAVEIAEDRQLGLVDVDLDARPPVCRLMTSEERARRLEEDDAEAQPTVLREVRVEEASALSDDHLDRCRGYLAGGDKVKVTLRAVGRSEDTRSAADRAFERLVDRLSGAARVERGPERAGRGMVVFLAPR